MVAKSFLLLILVLTVHTVSLSITPKTAQTAAVSFKTYDKDQDGLLSKVETKQYFNKQYMKDFQGIDIDPKFTESTLNHILKGDKNSNGLDLTEFIDVIVPKTGEPTKREPSYYDEQDL